MKLFCKTTLLLACAGTLAIVVPQTVKAAPVILDDFNVNEGHFTSEPATGSGSSRNIAAASTADRVTTDNPREGAGHQKIVIATTVPGNATLLRHLSGAGTAANNTAFTTSAGTDGWIGLYIKTADASTDPNWTVSIWIEGSGANNGAVPKTIIADGEWHLYEWDLDNTAGDENGWGDVTGILSGSPTVNDGSHTIDSVIFRNAAGPASTTLYMDFVARNDAGSVSDLLLNPCINTTGVLVNGPISTNSNQVLVVGVADAATAVTVYQDSGAGMVSIGSKTTGITAGNNFVTVSGLVKSAQVSATQTVNGQESCVPPTGIFVGGGANPSVRVAFTIRETTSDTGPIGAPAQSTSANLHFLGATQVSGGAPIDAPIVTPSNDWQTFTLERSGEQLGTVSNVVPTLDSTAVYGADMTIQIQVYAFKTVNGITIFSPVGAESSVVTSNVSYAIDWTWDPVEGAEGYRLLRNVNGGGYADYADVFGANSVADRDNIWGSGNTVTPTVLQTSPSVQWNPTIGNTNNLPGQWGILESINFAIDSDTGPFDIYLDNIQNGPVVFQTFENAVAGTTDFGFRSPSFSGTTAAGLLTSPNEGVVTNSVADTGTKSFHLRYQWNGTNASKWVRLTTSGVGTSNGTGNPLVNLDEPISVRILLLPVGAPAPTPPPAPSINVSRNGSDVILNWEGAHRLLEATDVAGPYTTNGAIFGPFTNAAPADAQRFYQLKD